MNRYKSAEMVGKLGITANIFLFIIKIIVGFISMSYAMIADAFNSAGDIFASIMTSIGNKISREPRDEDHNFGHGKAEYIFSMFISISMVGVSIKLIYDSVMSVIKNNTLNFSISLVIVCIVTIVIKFSLYSYCRREYTKYNNLLVKASMIDHRNDCILTTLSFIAIMLGKAGINWFDGIAGALISCWILYSGIGIFKESYDVLMDKAIGNDIKDGILAIAKDNKDILGVGKIYSVPVGIKYVIVITIFVKGNMSTSLSHNITDTLEEKIQSKFDNIEKVVVHVEPYLKEKANLTK